MYTFSYFCFGHELSVDKELNNSLNDMLDLSFSRTINGKKFEAFFPYHGGQVKGDCYSCVFGIIITDSYNNKQFLKTIRACKESDYINDYNQFIVALISEL